MECLEACPWSVPRFNEHTGKMIKCDFCVDRIDNGLEPACVTACTTHALKFALTKKKSAKKAA
jgi:Fe-S-cluster-containing dehydrogenase component